MKTLAVLFSLASALAMGVVSDPVGQKAHYQLDTDPARTSDMIHSGTIDVLVAQLLDHATPPAYEVRLDYKFEVDFIGSKEGTKTTNIDTGYFKPEFLDNLRKTGHYEGADFKAQHLGYEDTKTMDGKSYTHCDKVRLYDIKQDSELFALTSTFLSLDRADIQNLEVVALIYPGIPVLGAVKIDASGTTSGMDVKAGGDYVCPTEKR